MRFSAALCITILGATGFSAALVEKEISKVTSKAAVFRQSEVDGVDDSEDGESYSPTLSSACSQEHYHVRSQADLDHISNQCKDIAGSIVINGYYSPIIDTGSLQSVGGDIRISNATNLVRVNLPMLTVIGGAFTLRELTSLTSVNGPYLNTVGVIDWKILPILSTINFESGLVDVKSITISDTSMTGFYGFDVDSLDTLNINNNRFMESISSNLKGITRRLSISANARNAQVSFPNLEYANNITIRDVSSLNIQSIENVNSSMELINNNFQDLKFPKLKFVGGTLSLIENYQLRNVEFPVTEDIGGGLMVVNNTNINKINFLPRLLSVGGAIEFVGDFKEASFAKLNLVRGSAIIKSASDTFDCSRWIRGGDQNGTHSSIIRGGKIVCTSAGKQQVVKYDQDGTVVDEEISFIEDADSDSAKMGENAGVAIGVSKSMFSIVALGAISYVLGF